MEDIQESPCEGCSVRFLESNWITDLPLWNLFQVLGPSGGWILGFVVLHFNLVRNFTNKMQLGSVLYKTPCSRSWWKKSFSVFFSHSAVDFNAYLGFTIVRNISSQCGCRFGCCCYCFSMCAELLLTDGGKQDCETCGWDVYSRFQHEEDEKDVIMR